MGLHKFEISTLSHVLAHTITCTVKPVKDDQKNVFTTNNHLMQVKSIAECSQHSAVLLTCIKVPHARLTLPLAIVAICY